MTKNYDHKKIETKWQREWEKADVYKTTDTSDKPKCYVLDMFPFPSGEGLHVGHPKGYIASDIYSRFKKMSGYNILHPMGWDAFGLPTEQYAIKNKIHPRKAVEKNVARFKEQLSVIGFNYDWKREINTTDTKYYKWTQWIFLKLLEKGLAYESFEPVNWCPSCQTGLANEDLEGNACERCGTIVEKKPMRQWVLRITDYADRLLTDLDSLNWPEHVKEAQRNWIGKSEGAEITFATSNQSAFKVFTTRPDTLFGATYAVLSPEHKLLDEWKEKITNWEEIKAYREEVKKKTEIERTSEGKEKTGVRLIGVTAKNPANGEDLPIFIADYVLAHYGTGAIMAVPAHDTRDFEFAKKFGMFIRPVIEPVLTQTSGTATFRKNEPIQQSNGIICIIKHWSEDKYLGLKWQEAGWGTFLTGGIDEGFTPEQTVLKEIHEETGYKNATIVRKIGIIHSRYYHEPKKLNRFGHAPTFYVELQNGECDPVLEEETLKHEMVWLTKEELKTFLTAESHQQALVLLDSPLYIGEGILTSSAQFDGMSSEEAKKVITEFVGGKIKTIYKLKEWVFSRQRYWGEPIPVIHCDRCGVVPVPEKDLPVVLPEVDSYEPSGTGESPLANIHDWVNVKCPICRGDAKRETNTMPNWAGSSWYYLRYLDPRNQNALVDKEKEKYWSPVDVYVGGDHATRHLIYARFWHKFLFDIGAVNYSEPFKRLEFLGNILAEDGRKMSKRWGNVINPDDIVEIYGADTLRVYEMFMGPFENTSAWNTESIIGPRRFLEKVWKLSSKVKIGATASRELETSYHQTIKRISENIEDFKFNTAVSGMMIFLNELEKEEMVSREMFEGFLKLLTPFAPHIAEELWHDLGNNSFIYEERWPIYDEEKTKRRSITIAVQVNGKLRATFEAGSDIEEEAVKKEALEQKEVMKWLEGKEPKKVIYVKGKLVSVVT
ncbi:leucine--tRNA ligase [bacterium]|nr:MAG: leucine--tRNA ligase [bacterium]